MRPSERNIFFDSAKIYNRFFAHDKDLVEIGEFESKEAIGHVFDHFRFFPGAGVKFGMGKYCPVKIIYFE